MKALRKKPRHLDGPAYRSNPNLSIREEEMRQLIVMGAIAQVFSDALSEGFCSPSCHALRGAIRKLSRPPVGEGPIAQFRNDLETRACELVPRQLDPLNLVIRVGFGVPLTRKEQLQIIRAAGKAEKKRVARASPATAGYRKRRAV